MAQIRKPYQGVWNIIRFNWHFYALSFIFLSILFISKYFLRGNFHFIINTILLLSVVAILISLIVSHYVYDLSGIYKLNWVRDSTEKINIININAGFDETSTLLREKFASAELAVFDFYNPSIHTEVSIKRARKAYPSYPGTKIISTLKIELPDNHADKIFVLFAAHEIRNDAERTGFFKELYRILKPNGQLFVLEHLRDFNNFLAYNFGFFHFFKKSTWTKTFNASALHIEKEQKVTPFISLFELKKHGTTA